MLIIPFGEIEEDRFEEARKYNLVEQIAGIWRLTDKCRKHYDDLSYLKYLRGSIAKHQVEKVSKEGIVKTLLDM
jgi:hypothetical protein